MLTTSAPPREWARSAISATSSIPPKKFGYWTTTQASLVIDPWFQHRRGGHITFAGIGSFHQLDVESLQIRAEDAAICRMNGPRDHDAAPTLWLRNRHQRAFRQSSRAVINRGVGDIHPCQGRDEALKLVDDLQCPLSNLRLIRGICSVKLATGEYLTDRRRHEMPVRSRAKKNVLGRDSAVSL